MAPRDFSDLELACFCFNEIRRILNDLKTKRLSLQQIASHKIGVNQFVLSLSNNPTFSDSHYRVLLNLEEIFRYLSPTTNAEDNNSVLFVLRTVFVIVDKMSSLCRNDFFNALGRFGREKSSCIVSSNVKMVINCLAEGATYEESTDESVRALKTFQRLDSQSWRSSVCTDSSISASTNASTNLFDLIKLEAKADLRRQCNSSEEFTRKNDMQRSQELEQRYNQSSKVSFPGRMGFFYVTMVRGNIREHYIEGIPVAHSFVPSSDSSTIHMPVQFDPKIHCGLYDLGVSFSQVRGISATNQFGFDFYSIEFE